MRDAKRSLRERVIAARDAVAPEQRAEASAAIAARIAALPSFERASVVLLTLPFRSEWDATLLARRALASGKRVAVPRVDPVARMLRVLLIKDLQRDVEAGYRAIPEPRTGCAGIALEEIDWVLVPGVAFDAAGRRLGYGGGYYDRLLPLLRPKARRIAGAFDVQFVDAVPAAPHDITVDCIVTENRMIDGLRGNR